MRYAYQMGFGQQTRDVSKTALRIVSRMVRDSIHTGRRPSGFCGAALIIAARHHGLNRNVNDVLKHVKVHSNTVRKRMEEFGETASANLTLDEFMQVDLEEEHAPPAFIKSKEKERRDKDYALVSIVLTFVIMKEVLTCINYILRQQMMWRNWRRKLTGKSLNRC